MASETPLLSFRLPIINFSNQNLKPGEPQWDVTRADVKKALQDYGCFEAYFDTIPIELRKSVFEAVEELFDLPLQTKLKNVSTKPHHGYFGQLPNEPLFELMGIGDSNNKEKVDAFTENLWPEGNKSFSTKMHSFSEKLSELDKTIKRMIMESFGIMEYFDEYLDSTYYILRVNKYKAPKTEETKVALTSHTDKTMVTILYLNHVEGLEIQMKDKSWIKVKPSQDSFVVMVGDVLHAFLNGRLPAPYHRVMMKGSETRYSLALSSIQKAGHIISSPDELVDEQHPRLYKPFEHAEFLEFVRSQGVWASDFALKTYCGV